MPMTPESPTPGADTAPSAAWAALRSHLETLRAGVLAEIRGYPPPITACDAQFNHLLERRSRLQEALRTVEAAMNAPEARTEPARALERCLSTLAWLDEDTRQAVRARL